jgi:peptide/nickel transport system substrate-binding protein
VLHVEPGELDLDRFEQLFRDGREALARGDADAASDAQRAALDLWRGAALADVLDEPFAQAESGRLEDRRLLALEERIEADLALGAASTVVPELEALVREQPFRERPLGQLMLALYRGGRQAEALAALQAGRQRLVGDLGLEPGPQLGELQRKILEHDPSLAAPGVQSRDEPPEGQRRNRRKVVAAGAGAAVVAAAVSLGIVLGTGGTNASSRGATVARAVGLNSKSGAVAGSVPLPGNPAAIAAGRGSLWLADPNAGAVVRVDLDSQAVADRIPVGGSPGALAVGGGSVWVASVPEGGVSRIDPETGEVTQRLELGVDVSALAFGGRALWVADVTDNSLLEIDPASGTIRRTVALHVRPTALAIDGVTIWVAGYGANSISEVELRSGQTVATISVGNGPAALAVGEGALWVVNGLDSTVSRIDPTAGSIVATIPVGSGPTAVAVAGDSVWVANQNSGTVSRIDPVGNTVVGTVVVGGGPTTLAAADGKIWVGARPSIERRGGTLMLVLANPISIDPGLQLNLFPLQSDGLTRDGLVTYNHAPGPAGTQLVPDLAIRLPAPTEGGTVYTFRLRSGIRYSDGRPVQAGDFRRAIERVFRLHSGGRDLFASIVGAAECARQGAIRCVLSGGIVTDERSRTVTFRLNAPDPDFLAKLAYGGLATAVPAGTPLHDIGFTPIPGTGPYKVAAASEREIRYVRNSLFREWSHAAQPEGNPDEIVMRFGLSPDQEIRAIQQGRADWAADNVPAHLLPVIRTQFAGQLHSNPTTETDFLQFNTKLPPFDDVRVRRALNLAIDRGEIVRMYGGTEAAVSTCQVLPAGIPGYRRYCPYTFRPDSGGAWTAPDVARAQELVAASGTRGAHVTVWGWTDDPTISPRVVHYTAGVLRRLGYRASVRLVSHASFDRLPPKVLRTVQLIPAGWLDTTAYNFFAPWLSCRGAINHGKFCDRRIDRAMQYARSLEGANGRAAASAWASVDRSIVDQAAWVPLVNPRLIDFVSARVRNYQHHPYWGILVDQLWLQ